ncbi:MAG TPA: type II toxin-antitoxin system HicB family antitoxin [Candidatus Kapabacteria bacterium]|nr:type II toxin-antitoxin system HicB family antitoxin [Candidatus Kapabacteria bacterium]
MRFQVNIYQDEDGMYIADCPIIPGCMSQGKTFEEAQENIKDAIRGCLEVREELGLPPIMQDLREVEVTV